MSDNQTRDQSDELRRSGQRNPGPRRRRTLTTLGILGGLCVLVGIILAATGGGHQSTSTATTPRSQEATSTATAPRSQEATSTATAPHPRVEPTVTSSSPAREPSSSPASSPPAGSSPVRRPGAAASLPVIPRTVATYSGSGNQTTPVFTTTATWQLVYSFNCSEFGTPARAEVVEGDGVRPGKVLVNTRTFRAEGSTHVNGDAGSHYLQVNSPCSWAVKVVDQP